MDFDRHSLEHYAKGVKRVSRFHPYNHPPRGKYGPAGHNDPLALFRRCSLSSATYAPHTCLTLPTEQDEHNLSSEYPIVSEPPPPFEPEAPVEWTDTDRAEYARCLVDNAVETLSAKWYQCSLREFPQVLQFIRNVDGTISLPHLAQMASTPHPAQTGSMPQPAPMASLHGTTTGFGQTDAGGNANPRYPYQSTHEHMPLRQFLHEVLRRSRTSCTVLQVALCYVEAVAVKLPRMLDEEVRRVETYNVGALMAEIPTMSPKRELGVASAGADGVLPTAAEASLPPLPSPLLCPRRTFLAALLLASKFMQDRSYSNKAWGKLTGLSPREVSRCERALAGALEWRLWVGHMELLPRGFKDDGAPVVAGDATFTPEPPEPAASEPVLAVIEEHIRRTMDMESAGARRRALRRTTERARSLPDVAAIPRRSLAAMHASARTATWVNTLPPILPALPLPVGAKTPIVGPTPLPQPLASTLVDHFPSSGSPPESLVHTQSSVDSFATFSEVSTPPDTQELAAPLPNYTKMVHGLALPMIGYNADVGIPGIPEIPLVEFVGAGGRY